MPTKQELFDLAEEHGIEVPASATKAELVDALKDEGVDVLAETDNGEDDEDATTEGAPAEEGDDEGEPGPTPSEQTAPAAAEDEDVLVGPGFPGGDLDVKDVPEGNSGDEFPAPLNVEDWVVLDGSHEDVPDYLDSHIAYIVEAPRKPAPDARRGPNAAETVDEEEPITVRTRDQYNATLIIPLDAVKSVGRGGRSAVLPFG